MRGIGTQAPLAPGQVQQAGAEAVQQQAKAQAEARQQEAQMAVGVQEARLGQQAMGQRDVMQQRKLALGASLRNAENSLAALSMTTKQQMFDATMQFEQDELGRTIFNERQLLDYAISKAKDVEDLQNYEQTVGQMSERRMRLLQAAQAKIQQELQQAYAMEENELTQEHKLGLARAKAALEAKMQQEKADAANRAAMFNGIFTIAGGVAGAIIAGPGGYAVGAAAGASIGGGLGTLASTIK